MSKHVETVEYLQKYIREQQDKAQALWKEGKLTHIERAKLDLNVMVAKKKLAQMQTLKQGKLF